MEFYIGYLKAAAPKYWWLQGPEHPVLARHNNEQIVTFYCLYCAFEAATVDWYSILKVRSYLEESGWSSHAALALGFLAVAEVIPGKMAVPPNTGLT
jgi:hypothetical protein